MKKDSADMHAEKKLLNHSLLYEGIESNHYMHIQSDMSFDELARRSLSLFIANWQKILPCRYDSDLTHA